MSLRAGECQLSTHCRHWASFCFEHCGRNRLRYAGAKDDLMRQKLALLFLGSTLPLPLPMLAQAVPEGVHKEANGASNVCGVTGQNALAIREKLRIDPTIAPEPSGSPRFETYFSKSETKQWTVTTRFDPAYPAVTCVHLYNAGGGTDMNRQMRCDASRKACDAIFLEFRAHDEQIKLEVRGG